jgi:3-methylfumaryl-CoA hydratase
MWAAGAIELVRPLRLGRAAEKISRIASIDVKRGKSGQLVFVNVDHELRQDEVSCLRERQTLVYRELPQNPEPLGPGEAAATSADWSRSFEPAAVQLFRFSALTYNGHRIHYDRAYATAVEHYPGLVVHGPLLVVLLLDLLPPELAASARNLRFRAVRPSFDLGPVSLRGKRERDEIALWSADHENYVGMQAQLTLADARGIP